jgi:phosphoribosyl 1,2-cyclic phosphodiesterase
MKLFVIATGSKGNCYVLQGEKDSIIIEAGSPFKDILKTNGIDHKKINSVLVSHEHQ